MSKNIFLLGSNGYLGSRIKAQLKNQYSIFELNRKEIQELDFNQNKLLFEDIIFHSFINTIVEYQDSSNITEIIKSNYLLSFEILNLINKSKEFKIFHFDSFYSKFYNFDRPNSYLLSKKNLVEWSKIYHNKHKEVTTFILRLEHIIGSKENTKKFNGWLISKLKSNETIELGPCDHFFDFIHVDDIVKAIILLVDTEKFKNTFNHLEVGSGNSYQLKTFVNKLKLKLGSRSKIIFNEIDNGDFYKNQSSVADSKELINLGWCPKSDLNEIIDSIL